MILTCEKCQSRYLVPGHSIGPEGRRVRCTACGHEWFFKKDRDISREIEEEEGDNTAATAEIPESIRPVQEKEDSAAVAVVSKPAAKKESGAGEGAISPARLAGYAVAAAIFALIVGGGIVARTQIAALWPPSIYLYEKMNLKISLEGERLIFENLSAEVRQDHGSAPTLEVKADILNLGQDSSRVPPVRLSLIGEHGEMLDHWLVKPEPDRLEPGERLSIQTSYPGVPETVREINTGFALIAPAVSQPIHESSAIE